MTAREALVAHAVQSRRKIRHKHRKGLPIRGGVGKVEPTPNGSAGRVHPDGHWRTAIGSLCGLDLVRRFGLAVDQAAALHGAVNVPVMLGKGLRQVVSLETSRPRAGRRFEPSHELELLPDALRAAKGLPGAHRGLVMVSEMTGPNGIPDFTALVGEETKLDSRLSCDVPPLLNEVDAGVVSVSAVKQARSAQQLAGLLGWPEATVARRLPSLVRNGALSDEGGRFTRHEALQPLGRLYAIEVKVSDWRRALRQARVYSLWADNYVLVLGRLTDAASTLALDQVEIDSAGLYINNCWHRKPTSNKLPPYKRLWAAEYLVAALRG